MADLMTQTKLMTRTTATTTTLVEVVFAALLGAAILFTAGFAQSQTLHDAAHDTRHTSGFPCH